MSFSYWGADKVTIQKPAGRPRQSGIHGGTRRGVGSSSYSRESSANAKFGTRLVSGESSNRPASRRTQGTPVSRRLQPLAPDDNQSVRVTTTRPAWDSSPRSPVVTAVPTKRTRNTSQTSTTVTRTPVITNKLPSPAPSEDSGVGLYRQIITQDPSFSH